ncbi:MAG TPA: hypothetical protein VHP31_09540 [Caproicibacter sp.]|nr:hypothetical protein [Caproicibacter sp.]
MAAISVIQNYLLESGKTVIGCSMEDLIDRLYNDIFEYSILTDPLKDIWVNRISVNGWNDIRVWFANGKSHQIEGFISQQQATETIGRLLTDSGLNCNTPFVQGKLRSMDANITVYRNPVTQAGIRCIIRKSSKRVFTEKDYITSEFASQKELNFLKIALQHGISILLTGLRQSGKTSFMEYLTRSIPDYLNVTIAEKGYREIESGNELLFTDERQNELIIKANGVDSDILAFNFSSWAALKASQYISSVIAQSVGHDPKVGLSCLAYDWMDKYPCDFTQAASQACEAFPIVVFLNMLPDRKRRIMSISESHFENGQITLNPLWQYKINNMTADESGTKIQGHHVQTGYLSDELIGRMKLFGVTPSEIQSMKREENTDA